MSKPDTSGITPSQPESIPSKPSAPIQTDSPVLTLDNDNFKTSIGSQEPTLVFFFASWCGSCVKFKPIYFDVAKELAGKSPIRFALYDCSSGGEIAEEYGISRFPSLKLFRSGKFERDFEGKRNPEDLKTFVAKFSNGKGVV
ncbi:protein disulfide-isomerase-like [Harmonia axyridis]|uniref:protein disulfide-isomerase-like n=1 Tax=Harmonia axyridis TaxID=115357 RepID=UPI001E279080|nr:protein disulfide-isomerase-like [Harmonia axyridis]